MNRVMFKIYFEMAYKKIEMSFLVANYSIFKDSHSHTGVVRMDSANCSWWYIVGIRVNDDIGHNFESRK
jgi:hypothetical protein